MVVLVVVVVVVCVCVSACLSFYFHFRSSIIFGLTFQIADDLGSQLLLYLIYAMEKLMKICNKKWQIYVQYMYCQKDIVHMFITLCLKSFFSFLFLFFFAPIPSIFIFSRHFLFYFFNNQYLDSLSITTFTKSSVVLDAS